jgi:hypothetical protein
MAERAMKTSMEKSKSTSKTTKPGNYLLECPEGGANVLRLVGPACLISELRRLGQTQLFDSDGNSSVANLDDRTSSTNLHAGKPNIFIPACQVLVLVV